MSRVAVVTCRDLPEWEVDDRALFEALRRRGLVLAHPVWDDPDVDWSRFDAALIRTTWDYAERRAAFVAWADRAGTATRLFNPPPVVRWNTHKAYLRDLAARGVPIVPTRWLRAGSTVDLGGLLGEAGWERAFLKPAIGATSRETLRFDASAEGLAAGEAHLARLLPSEDMMLQPYLAQVERDGELSAILVDGQPTHAVRKIPAPGDYRAQDDFGARDEPVTLTEAQSALVTDAVAAALDALRGPTLLYARVDLLMDRETPLVCELELVEPALFFRHGPEAADRLADALCRRLEAEARP